jgi:hypothetical protein
MNKITEKQTYSSPSIERIALDNEISLILVSGDPGDPIAPATPFVVLTPEYLNNDPFKTSSMG